MVDSSRLMERFLRSRFLPTVTILALLAGSFVTGGGVLWSVRIREEHRGAAEIDYRPHAAGAPAKGGVLKLTSFDRNNWLDRLGLSPGQPVTVGVDLWRSNPEMIPARFIGTGEEGQRSRFGFVLGPVTEEQAAVLATAAGGRRLTELSLTFRGKRLLVSAFNRGS